MRQALVRLHRWFGLAASVWLLGVCLSGTVISFEHEIDAALNPDLFRATAEGDVGRAVARAQVRYPDQAIRFVLLDYKLLGLVRVGMKDAGERPREVFVDSGTGTVLGSRAQDENGLGRRAIVATVYRLHAEFLGGAALAWVLGLVALLWTIDHFVALGIAWTSRARWAESFRIRRGARGYKLHFDLHRATALWLWPVTLMLAVSGLSFLWPREVDRAVSLVSQVTPDYPDRAAGAPAPAPAPRPSWSQAYARFAALAAPETVTSFSYNEKAGAWRARMHDPRDLSPNGMRIVWMANDGRVLDDRHETQGSAGDKALAWMFPLHSGTAFGLAGRVVIAATGLVVALMIVTGLLMWARKRRGRRTRAARHPDALGAPAIRPAVAAGAAAQAAGPRWPGPRAVPRPDTSGGPRPAPRW